MSEEARVTQPTTDPLPSMHCVCGHWDTEHAAFISKIKPGRTRTVCDHCDCRYWMTPEDKAEIDSRRSRATALRPKEES